MPKKKSFVLRLDPDMYDAVEKWAADEFRSTNGHIEWIINEALKKAGRKPKPKNKEQKTKNEEPNQTNYTNTKT